VGRGLRGVLDIRENDSTLNSFTLLVFRLKKLDLPFFKNQKVPTVSETIWTFLEVILFSLGLIF